MKYLELLDKTKFGMTMYLELFISLIKCNFESCEHCSPQFFVPPSVSALQFYDTFVLITSNAVLCFIVWNKVARALQTLKRKSNICIEMHD